MTADLFNIYVEQLREGHEEILDETFDPTFLDIHEADLKFDKPVKLEGSAAIAENELLFHWNIETEALVSCAICNEPLSVPICIENFYASEPVSEIKTGIYNYKDLLRETILLEVPHFVECQEGRCPKRKDFDKYLKESSDQDAETDGYRPFADLEDVYKPSDKGL